MPLVMGRIVDEHADRAKLRGRGGNRRLHGRNVAQIAGDEHRRRMPRGHHARHQRTGRRLLDIDKRHLRTLGREMRHMGGTDAGGPAGDEHTLAAQARIGRVVRMHGRSPLGWPGA